MDLNRVIKARIVFDNQNDILKMVESQEAIRQGSNIVSDYNFNHDFPMNATASLFSNAKANASREDIAMGLIWMVLQSIGSATILSSLESGIKDFVMIGNLTLLPQCREVFPAMEKLYGVRFRIPKYSEFCTAIGAALDYKNKTELS